jgi:multidrug efflux system membrane fusion protein
VKSTYIAAFVVAALFVAWLFSGQLGNEEARQPAPSLAQSRDAMLAEAQDAPVRVRARLVAAEEQTEDLVVRGRTEADRSVVVRAETSGRVVELPVEKGDRVEAGALLCRIAVDTREARLEEMRQAVAQASIEFDGARKLRERGLQSETAIAAAEARLAAARADLAQMQLDLERTYVRAPFAGVVEERPVEMGDLLQAGGACATVVDPDPMMLVGQVAEREVGRLVPGEAGFGRLVTGDTVAGTVAFVANTAAPTTRTFRVEVAVPNADGALRDGITTEIRIPVERFLAHRIPSSIIALDDAGELGVRILDADDRVQFVNVRIVKDEPDAIWVRGLPDPARIITVGQELVTPGQQVEAVYEAGNAVSRSEGGEDASTSEEPSSIALPASSSSARGDAGVIAATAAL